jgi:hypothetical protein
MLKFRITKPEMKTTILTTEHQDVYLIYSDRVLAHIFLPTMSITLDHKWNTTTPRLKQVAKFLDLTAKDVHELIKSNRIQITTLNIGEYYEADINI